MSNRLANETSPYLLQHKENPVDWYAWSDEALAASREQDKPILLSIGYSACHWCHVMAHESFENPNVARIMNDLFINIKVDREERPDLDSLYMMSVQMLTGHGGWPMTVFLTPEGKPFYGGTYYPPEDRGGMPGFPRVLHGVAEAYHDRRDAVLQSATQLTDHLRGHFERALPPSSLGPDIIVTAAGNLAQHYDRAHGGFGGAPKFPSPMSIEFLFRVFDRKGSDNALQMAEYTLDRMARGGLYDQVGGGFHRYTVDAIWLVPHFEKMLYDNAQLAAVYALAHQITEEPFYRAIAEETLDYVLREMTSPEGGFYSTQDADTEGEEGKFYAWTPAEINAVLGDEDGALVSGLLGATGTGNFEGSNVLQIVNVEDRMTWRAANYDHLRQKLYEARGQRTQPGRDDKVLTSWNGLMLRAFATAAWVLDSEEYANAARANASFIQTHLIRDGKLLHSFKDGEAKINGFLEDYAFLIDGLVELYGATFEIEWLEWAAKLAHTALDEFYDAATSSFYDTAESAETLISRPKDAFDSATPSGNSVICEALTELAHLTDDERFRSVATGVLETYAAAAAEQPHGFSRLLLAIDLAVGPTVEVAIIGDPSATDTQAMVSALRDRYLPRISVATAPGENNQAVALLPVLRERGTIDGKATAYVCVGFSCQLPTNDVDTMLEQIDSSMRRS
ncbi:thioredoxin domain-containing protein [soil metagenome]